MGDHMKGKRGLIMGLANDRSLAWGIAKALASEGAELAFSYQGEALERRVRDSPARTSERPTVDRSIVHAPPFVPAGRFVFARSTNTRIY